MNEKFLLLLTIIGMACFQSTFAKTYYVSPQGNDQFPGNDEKHAWKSLDRVNKEDFKPGDSILFEAGKVWKGQLFPKGSGKPGAPIVLSSYGGDERPVIHLGSAEGAGIRLTNQAWWVIENMEVTSGAKPQLGVGRQGIVSIVEGDEELDMHLTIRNCYIHDIWGQLGGKGEYEGYNSAAILVRSELLRKGVRKPNRTTFDHVLVENNRIERIDKCGIIIRGGKNDIVVRRNKLDNIGGDGIFLNGSFKGLIEHNIVNMSCLRSGNLDVPGADKFWPHTAAIWIQGADSTLIQYNEVYHTGREEKNNDGMAFDFDYYVTNSIVQYNFAQNSGGGFVMFMGKTFGNIVRYNINENSHFQDVRVNSELDLDKNKLHNNVFYRDFGKGNISFYGRYQNDVNKRGALFENNIFYATGQGKFRVVYVHGMAPDAIFDEDARPEGQNPGDLFLNNWYYGAWNRLPDDPQRTVENPGFSNPGSGGADSRSLAGYRFTPESAYKKEHKEESRTFFGGNKTGSNEELYKGIFPFYEGLEGNFHSSSEEKKLDYIHWLFSDAVLNKTEKEISLSLMRSLGKEIEGKLYLVNNKDQTHMDSISFKEIGGKKEVAFRTKDQDSKVEEMSLLLDLRTNTVKRKYVIPLSKLERK